MVRSTVVKLALAPAVAALASGCLLAAGGAVAGGGVYLTTRGAEAVVHGDIEAVGQAAREAFGRLSVDYRGQRDDEDGNRQVYGATDDGEVTVELERRTENATRVEVRVRKSTVTWDKEMARTILEEIRAIREG